MQAQAQTLPRMRAPLPMDKYEPQREHWELSKQTNINLIIQNKVQMKMALNVIELCEEEIKKLPEVKKK